MVVLKPREKKIFKNTINKITIQSSQSLVFLVYSNRIILNFLRVMFLLLFYHYSVLVYVQWNYKSNLSHLDLKQKCSILILSFAAVFNIIPKAHTDESIYQKEMFRFKIKYCIYTYWQAIQFHLLVIQPKQSCLFLLQKHPAILNTRLQPPAVIRNTRTE